MGIKSVKLPKYGNFNFITDTRAEPDSPGYTFRPPPEGPHKSMTFQHGCPHHWKPPGGMYFYNTPIINWIAQQLKCQIRDCGLVEPRCDEILRDL